MSITVDDFLLFCERTLDGYRDALGRLDDMLVTTAPDIPGANTPYQLTIHATAACRWWTSHLVCGLPSNRDRDAEFVAEGTVADALATLDALSAELADRRPDLEAAREVRSGAMTTKPLGVPWTVGACLIHAYEELAQHLGHLEITVDALLARHARL